MQIAQLSLKNFRNLNLETGLKPGINFVIAGNGSGKSNFLDSIFQLGFGHSFKRLSEGGNVNWDSRMDFAKISAKLIRDQQYDLTLVISELEDRNAKTFSINGRNRARKNFLNLMHVVLFAPQDLDIVSGPPDIRRSELDDFMSSFDEDYQDKLKGYRLVLRNRNKLLQRIAEGVAGANELPYWNERLADFGSNIIFRRMELLEKFRPVLTECAGNIFNAEIRDLQIVYLSKFAADGAEQIKEALLEKLAENSFKEIAAKRTLYGPHRDDFELLFNKRPLRLFGSRGQQRIAALILKLSMLDFLNRLLEDNAILLLDDIMSELDAKHRSNLEETLTALENQIVITAAHENDFSDEFLGRGELVSLAVS